MLQPSVPLQPKNPDRPLRIIVIGRISTVHQREESIEASFEYVDKYLREIYPGEIEVKYLGEQASGMLVDRATIREAEDLIGQGDWDVVIAEDLSRIFRNPRHQYNFVQDAVDAETRVICIGDNLDTADDNWETMMGAATLRHGLTVPDTRRRVRRTATYAFHRGGMVQKVRFGYRKLSKEETASGHFGPVGLVIAKRPECTPIIQEVRTRVMRGDAYSSIAAWLNDDGIDPPPYANNGRWSDRIVVDLLRDPILHGQRTFRRKKYELIYATGKHRRLNNPEPETECYPELAHLTAEEHQTLLDCMDRRSERYRHKTGRKHPLHGRPRSRTIWPAQHVRCATCGGLFHRYNKDSLKCCNSRKQSVSPCWNHVQVDCSLARKKVLTWLVDFSKDYPKLRAELTESVVAEPRRRNARFHRETQSLVRDIDKLERQSENLADAVAQGGRLDILLERLESVNEELVSARRLLSKRETEAIERGDLSTREALGNDLDSAIVTLAERSFEFGPLMRHIFAEFLIQPVQALDSGQVRPMAKLSIDLSIWSEEGELGADRLSLFHQKLALFNPPVYIVQMDDCVKLRLQDPSKSLRRIAADLGINYMTVKRALGYHRRMQAEGLSTPYRELEERPNNASRWAGSREQA
jgi:site-specific DNA recombinase